jgi:hypothetical protein
MAVSADEIIDALMTPMRQDLEDAGITSKYLVRKLKRELNAKTTKFFQHEGKVITTKTLIDWSTRQKARMDTHALRGDYPATKHQVTGVGGGPVLFGDVAEVQRQELLRAQVEVRKMMNHGKSGGKKKR